MQRRRFVILTILVLLATLVAASEPLYSMANDAVVYAERVIRRYPWWGAVVFVALSGLSAMLAFFSSLVIVPVAVYAWGETTTFALLWIGWLLGGMAAYSIGRYLGRPVVVALVSAHRIGYYEERLSDRVGFPVILLFQLALPSEIPGYVLGMMRYRFPTYLAALAVAELPFALGGVYVGGGFLRREYAVLLGLGIAGIALSAWAFHHLHRRLGSRPGD